MTIDINALPSFGKARRDEAWARVRRNQAVLSVSRLRFGLTIGLIAASIVMLGLDALALLINDGEQGLWLLPRAGEAMLTGLHPAVVGGVMLVIMIVLVDFAAGLMALFANEEPVAIVDYTGGIVLTRDGQTGFRWEDVERIRRKPGYVIVERPRRGIGRPGQSSSWEPMRISIPAFLIVGGTQRFLDALRNVRPDIVRANGL
jgi:hypothetical protein